MRKWLPTALCIAAGLVLGFAVGFIFCLNHIISNNPVWAATIPPRGDEFNRVFESMARLGSDEEIVKKPKWTSGALNNEDKVLHWLEDNKSSSYAPAIKVARVNVLVRRSIIIARPEPEADAKLQLLLKESGWKDTSPEHARALIKTIDKNDDDCKCPSAVTSGKQRK